MEAVGSSPLSQESAPIQAQISVLNSQRQQEAAVASTLIEGATSGAPRVEGQTGQRLNVPA